MGAKHVLRPKSHQRSLSYALNTSKLGDETVAFKFYGRCKQGLLTSPGWSAPRSARGCRWLAWVEVVVVCRGPNKQSGAGRKPTDQAVSKMSSCSRPHLESLDLKGFLGAGWTQADVHFKGLWFQRTSAGYGWGLCQSHLETDTLAERSGGGKAWWPYHRVTTASRPPLTDQKQTLASSKDLKGSRESSFAAVHSSQHLMWFAASCFIRRSSWKCETSKVATLLRVLVQYESVSCNACS